MRILLVWDYERMDLTNPIVDSLKNAEIFFIYKYDRAEANKKYPYQIIYWNNFSNPYKIISDIRPDKIVFMEIETFHQVSLNIAALNSGINTYRLEHGIKAPFSSYSTYTAPIKKSVAKRDQAVVKRRSGFNTLLFYLRSFRWKNMLSAYKFLKFIYTRTQQGINEGLINCKFKLRITSWYIDFTPFNSRFTLERDKPPAESYIYIGNPYFDKYFNYINNVSVTEAHEGNYYLLIDSAFVEDQISNMDIDTLLQFYMKLNNYCKSKNARLKIKLHPLSYGAGYLIDDPNIEYLRDVNVIKEILNSAGCFHSHFSTLTPLAMYYKPCVLFNAYPVFNIDIIEAKLITVLDFFAFDINDIVFTDLDDNGRKVILDRYLFATDGKACERLTKILMN
jgi:Alpha-2,8-polysialyltransferase (POLYST)